MGDDVNASTVEVAAKSAKSSVGSVFIMMGCDSCGRIMIIAMAVQSFDIAPLKLSKCVVG